MCVCVCVRAEKVSNVTPQQRTLIDAKMLLRKKWKKAQKSLTEIRQKTKKKSKAKQIKKNEACVKGICPVGHMLVVSDDTSDMQSVIPSRHEHDSSLSWRCTMWKYGSTCGPSGLINPTTWGPCEWALLNQHTWLMVFNYVRERNDGRHAPYPLQDHCTPAWVQRHAS